MEDKRGKQFLENYIKGLETELINKRKEFKEKFGMTSDEKKSYFLLSVLIGTLAIVILSLRIWN